LNQLSASSDVLVNSDLLVFIFRSSDFSLDQEDVRWAVDRLDENPTEFGCEMMCYLLALEVVKNKGT
jgi:hypothetical protein